jgi:hypothetical protein
MIQPFEMKETRPMELHDGVVSTTTDVWNILAASRDGDLGRVQELAQRCPALLTCQYDYTTPLHFAVCNGHLALVRYLVEQGALDPTYLTHPFRDSLVTMAEDRGYDEIAQFLKRSLDDPKLTRAWGDTGKIDYGKDETQRRFQELVGKNKHAEVEAMLQERLELALDETAFWGEGILTMPAKDGDRQMLELLMRHGARVSDLSKWGARYYFKHYEIAAFLLENGMNPNHMNWRRFTLLHDMAYTGDLCSAVPSSRIAINASRWPGTAVILPINPYIFFSSIVNASAGVQAAPAMAAPVVQKKLRRSMTFLTSGVEVTHRDDLHKESIPTAAQ